MVISAALDDSKQWTLTQARCCVGLSVRVAASHATALVVHSHRAPMTRCCVRSGGWSETSCCDSCCTINVRCDAAGCALLCCLLAHVLTNCAALCCVALHHSPCLRRAATHTVHGFKHYIHALAAHVWTGQAGHARRAAGRGGADARVGPRHAAVPTRIHAAGGGAASAVGAAGEGARACARYRALLTRRGAGGAVCGRSAPLPALQLGAAARTRPAQRECSASLALRLVPPSPLTKRCGTHFGNAKVSFASLKKTEPDLKARQTLALTWKAVASMADRLGGHARDDSRPRDAWQDEIVASSSRQALEDAFKSFLERAGQEAGAGGAACRRTAVAACAASYLLLLCAPPLPPLPLCRRLCRRLCRCCVIPSALTKCYHARSRPAAGRSLIRRAPAWFARGARQLPLPLSRCCHVTHAHRQIHANDAAWRDAFYLLRCGARERAAAVLEQVRCPLVR